MVHPICLSTYENGQFYNGRHCPLLPQPPWLIERLRAHGLQQALELEAESRACCSCVALAFVNVPDTDADLIELSRLSGTLESHLLQSYFGRGPDLFEVSLSYVWPLAEPCWVQLRKSPHGFHCTSEVTPALRNLIFYPAWNHEAEDIGARTLANGRTVQEALSVEVEGGEALAPDIACIQIPRPIWELARLGDWTVLMCNAKSWKLCLQPGLPKPFGEWPPEDWASRIAAEPVPLSTEDDRQLGSPEDFALLGRKLRQVAAALQCGCGGVGDGGILELRSAVQTLDAWALAAAKLRGDFPVKPRAHQHKHNIYQMVNCLRLIRKLRRGASALVGVCGAQHPHHWD